MLKRHCENGNLEQWWKDNEEICTSLGIKKTNAKGELRRVTQNELSAIKEVYWNLRAGNPNK